jgi:hypothetical protein
VIEEPVPEALGLEGLLAAHDARNAARDRLEQDQGGELATGDHVVADRELLGGETVRDPFVHPLVTPAHQHEPRLAGQLVHERLVQPPARGREEHTPLLPRPQRIDGGEDRLGLEHHARPSAEGVVVDLAAIPGVLAHVVDPDADQPPLDRLAQDGLLERALEERGEQGQHVDTHPPRG